MTERYVNGNVNAEFWFEISSILPLMPSLNSIPNATNYLPLGKSVFTPLLRTRRAKSQKITRLLRCTPIPHIGLRLICKCYVRSPPTNTANVVLLFSLHTTWTCAARSYSRTETNKRNVNFCTDLFRQNKYLISARTRT